MPTRCQAKLPKPRLASGNSGSNFEMEHTNINYSYINSM